MYERAIKKVVVDAGHGGSDPGAVGNGLKEKDLTLQAAQYMYKRLQELGIPATIIRNTDETLPREERIRRILAAYGDSPDVILVSNHINAGGGEGAEIVYSLRNKDTLANLALNNIGAAGQVKRKVYQRRLPENPNKDYYFIMRDSGKTEPILVEYGFIDNTKDVAKLKSELNNYVEAVVKAIAEYSNVPYTKPGTTPTPTPNTYVVQKGDTLFSIARQLNTTVAELRKINNLTSDILQVGQVLKTTSKVPEQTGTYKVQKGDTLFGIASKYNTTVDKIKQLNNLTSNTLFIGQELKVPSEENTEEYAIYEVIKGDSLWLIAKKYGITVDELIRLNNLTSLELQIGDKLKVPKKAIDTKYTVKNGDTLWSIARDNNVSVEALKQANNLTTNLLTVGQSLVIPK